MVNERSIHKTTPYDRNSPGDKGRRSSKNEEKPSHGSTFEEREAYYMRYHNAKSIRSSETKISKQDTKSTLPETAEGSDRDSNFEEKKHNPTDSNIQTIQKTVSLDISPYSDSENGKLTDNAKQKKKHVHFPNDYRLEQRRTYSNEDESVSSSSLRPIGIESIESLSLDTTSSGSPDSGNTSGEIPQKSSVDHNFPAHTSDSGDYTATIEDCKKSWSILEEQLQTNLKKIEALFLSVQSILSTFTVLKSFDQKSLHPMQEFHTSHQKIVNTLDNMFKQTNSFGDNLYKKLGKFSEISEAYNHLNNVYTQTSILENTLKRYHRTALLDQNTLNNEYGAIERFARQKKIESFQLAFQNIKEYMKDISPREVKTSIQSVNDILHKRERTVSKQSVLKEDQIEDALRTTQNIIQGGLRAQAQPSLYQPSKFEQINDNEWDTILDNM